MTDQKLHAIESVLAHQEEQIQDLNDVVIQQSKDIELLRKQVSKLYDKINMMDDSSTQEGGDLSTAERAARDKPPHY